jgi:hypothetical protein
LESLKKTRKVLVKIAYELVEIRKCFLPKTNPDHSILPMTLQPKSDLGLLKRFPTEASVVVP